MHHSPAYLIPAGAYPHKLHMMITCSIGKCKARQGKCRRLLRSNRSDLSIMGKCRQTAPSIREAGRQTLRRCTRGPYRVHYIVHRFCGPTPTNPVHPTSNIQTSKRSSSNHKRSGGTLADSSAYITNTTWAFSQSPTALRILSAWHCTPVQTTGVPRASSCVRSDQVKGQEIDWFGCGLFFLVQPPNEKALEIRRSASHKSQNIPIAPCPLGISMHFSPGNEHGLSWFVFYLTIEAHY